MKYSAWLAKAAKQPTVREAVDLGPLGVEDVEVAVESCGLCHSDLPAPTKETRDRLKTRHPKPGFRFLWSVTSCSDASRFPLVTQRLRVARKP
jgi:alcohol/geraniol dehydrogenase (NADP+)